MIAQPPQESPMAAGMREKLPEGAAPGQPVEYMVPKPLQALTGKERVSQEEFDQLMSSTDQKMAGLNDMQLRHFETGKGPEGEPRFQSMYGAAMEHYAALRSNLPAEEKQKYVDATRQALGDVVNMAVTDMKQRAAQGKDPALMRELDAVKAQPGFPKDYNVQELKPEIVMAYVESAVISQADRDNGLEAMYAQQMQERKSSAGVQAGQDVSSVAAPNAPRMSGGPRQMV